MGNLTLDNQKERFFIGIDGGGTKTEFVLFSESGYIYRRLLLGGSNPNSVGVGGCCGVLKEGVKELLRNMENVCCLYAGVSGMSSGDNKRAVNAFLREQFPFMKTVADSDIMNVIAGATDSENCVAAISGTGSSVFAYESGKLTRFSGWGYLLSDGGNGYDIGKAALQATLAERDGFGEKTLLTPIIESKLGGTVWSNIDKIYASGIHYIASFAGCVFEAYEKGDKVAEDILRMNMSRLSEIIDYAVAHCECGNELVLAGGILNEKETVLHFLKENLKSELKIIVPNLPQIYGACAQSLKLAGGLANEDFKATFTNDYKKIS